ncbi:MAG: response regulator [Nitrospinae bacterium]|nr:response regulator [Nitrospinota bacterium]MBL7019437.1 response regulator [Nitrospinaceae bacterium]
MNILVTDDIEDSRAILKALLEEKEHTVVTAPNGKVALDMIKESLPDMIVTDILMPEMDGFELCRRVRARPDWSGVIIIVYTGYYKSPADVELGYALGANEYIIKPQEPEIFLNLIENAIKEHKK